MPKAENDSAPHGPKKAQPGNQGRSGRGAKAAAPVGQGSNRAGAADGESAVAMLKADHRKVEGLFDRFAAADEAEKRQLIEQACEELVVHTLLEERLFYPAVRKAAADDQLEEAQVEHDSAKVLIVELMDADPADSYRDAKFKVLSELVRQHIKEEEAPGGLMAKAQQGGADTAELRERLSELKMQLMRRAQEDQLPDPEPVSFQVFGEPRQPERTDRDRDWRGRFAGDEDHYRRGGGGRSERGETERRYGRAGYERDRGQGGWFGDREGHAEAARRGWDDRESGYGVRSYRDEDRSYARRRDEDDDVRGRGGWSGDPQGHAEAARRGWQNRR